MQRTVAARCRRRETDDRWTVLGNGAAASGRWADAVGVDDLLPTRAGFDATGAVRTFAGIPA